jgi:two-component system CheB/CheR fusion protein
MADELSLRELIQIVADERGLNLRGYKHSTLDRRLRRRMFQLNIGSVSEYAERIRSDEQEATELLNTVLINVTEFLRDRQAWEVLHHDVLPKMLRSLRPGDSFRAWSAGCASGEEPYSLAILVADILGSRLGEFDVKIYATDIDDEALTAARRGEYTVTHLRKVRQDWRDRYFYGSDSLRINRDIRRLVIFGRSNLVSDAPISHCNVVICRNVLIYFDTDAQRQILKRLHYALEPGGILFLGKAESKLTESKYFRPIDSRWRIFQRITEGREAAQLQEHTRLQTPMADDPKHEQQVRLLRIQQRYLLDTLKAGVMILDNRDVIITHNEPAVSTWGLPGLRLNTKKLHNTELVFRCPELPARLESSKAENTDTVTFSCRVRIDSDERTIQVILKPMIGESGDRDGTVIYAEDVTAHEKLQNTVEQLEATGEELQSANEELETTNEELQSTNEELETTNEELQSTNEELETTNEELQSLNEELENMNEELERRTHELNDLTARYADTLRGMPWPVLLIDREERIQLWNAAAQRLFGVGATSVVGVNVDQLPISAELRKSVIRKYRTVLSKNKPSVLRQEKFVTPKYEGTFDLHFTPIGRDSQMDGVLVMFSPGNSEGAKPKSVVPANSARKTNSKVRKNGNHKKR